MQRGKADLGLLLVGMLWGLGFVFVKIGLNEGITPFYLLTIRFLVAFIILFAIFRSRLKNIEKSDLKNGFIIEEFAADTHDAVVYPAAIIKETKNKEEAEKFLKYLQNNASKEIFEKYGFKIR